eukprot:SAG11_NODE_1335_length_5174_cov_4.761773_2_plen_107_part_00
MNAADGREAEAKSFSGAGLPSSSSRSISHCFWPGSPIIFSERWVQHTATIAPPAFSLPCVNAQLRGTKRAHTHATIISLGVVGESCTGAQPPMLNDPRPPPPPSAP